MVSQRVYGLALGYEDLNDHEQLRKDPLFGVLAGREELDKPLAGKSTLNRLELGTGTTGPVQEDHVLESRRSMNCWCSVFLESHDEGSGADHSGRRHNRPAAAWQAGRALLPRLLRHYCYLPLYIFCGEHVLCARLRQSNSDASAGSLAEIERIVAQIRAAWPEVKIILRGTPASAATS